MELKNVFVDGDGDKNEGGNKWDNANSQGSPFMD